MLTDPQSDVCADCTALSPQWASVNRGVLLCDECSAVHRQLGRHISQVKHLKKSRWRPTQLEMVRYLAAACANRYWEHVLYEPMLAGQHSAKSGEKPKLTRKPNPTDPMHPTKADFIREKYLFLGFFKKPRNINLDDLNQQLHASVRTSVLETSLYLLALGADPNFIHPTKGTSPMHVACCYGQPGQVEILLAYGADVCLRDSRGQTPVDVALEKALAAAEAVGCIPCTNLPHEQKLRAAWSPLVDTLVNAYYEVTDSLAYFLSRRVPDHRSAVLGPSTTHSPALSTRHADPKIGHVTSSSSPNSSNIASVPNGHFLISTPLLLHSADGAESNGIKAAGFDDWIQEARRRLNQLPNMAFEDLCVDVYDEADRRLTNSFLEAMDFSSSDKKSKLISGTTLSNGLRPVSEIHAPVPPPHKIDSPANRSLTLYFLPPNTAYSSVRNQARQKLGRLSTVEFHTLVLDILTEISARLLPLFPPIAVASAWMNGNVTSHKPCTTTGRSLDSNGVPVPSRSIPLPSPPATGVRPADQYFASRDIADRESTAQLSSHSSTCAGGSEFGNESKLLEDGSQSPIKAKPQQRPQQQTESESASKRPGTRAAHRRDPDDPIYDQVAPESDLAGSFSSPDSSLVTVVHAHDDENAAAAASRLPISDHGPSPPSSSPTISATSLTSNQPTNSDAAAVSLSITSHPGPIPGSRRLHLGHTSRVTKHRASVPSSSTSGFSSAADFTLSPILEAVNLATTTCPTTLHTVISTGTAALSDSNVAQATQTTPPLSNSTGTSPLSSPLRGFVQPCCVAARNEVDRLRRENALLHTQVLELELCKENVNTRLKDLEERMKELGQTVELLREEKSALMAALSAGMVKTHSPPRPHEAPVETGTVPNSCSSSHVPSRIDQCAERSGPPSSLQPLRTLNAVCEEEYDEERTSDQEYSNEGPDKSGETGNYSVGLQCLDSGILLRQGILRATGASRGGSPASGTQLLSHQHHNTAECAVTDSSVIHTTSPVTCVSVSNNYVNVTRGAPRIPPKPNALHSTSSHLGSTVTSSTRTMTTAVPLQQYKTHSSSPSDVPPFTAVSRDTDYTAPNATGSPSPGPSLVTSRPGGEMTVTQLGPIPINISTASPSSMVGARLIQREELKKQHAQILASIAALPDYETAADGKRSTTSTPGTTSNNSGKSTCSITGWSAPSSDKVVRCVEAIILRIRSLVQLANGDRIGDCVNCSLLIQAAVQDILNLFPPLTQCPPKVATALSDLSSVSQSLRPHCEQMSRRLGPTDQPMHGHGTQKALAPEVNILIRHAHQIAKAAKELLSIFQRAQ